MIVGVCIYYHAHVALGFLRGTSSRTIPADTILFNFRFLSSSISSLLVLPSLNTTLIFESGCCRIP